MRISVKPVLFASTFAFQLSVVSVFTLIDPSLEYIISSIGIGPVIKQTGVTVAL